MPTEHQAIDPEVVDTIKVMNTHPDFLRKGRTSWIDPDSYLFNYLHEEDSEEEEEYDEC